MNYKKLFTIASFLFLILAISSCTSSGDVTEYKAGFFAGLWDGFTIVYSLLQSIFHSGISLIADNNSGFVYYLGYFLGVIIAIPVELISLFLIISVFSRN